MREYIECIKIHKLYVVLFYADVMAAHLCAVKKVYVVYAPFLTLFYFIVVVVYFLLILQCVCVIVILVQSAACVISRMK